MSSIIQPIALHLRTHWDSIALHRVSIMGLISSCLCFSSEWNPSLWKSRILHIIKIFSPKAIRSVICVLRKWLWARRAPQDTLMTPEMEDKYWQRIKTGQLNLQRSDARYVDINGVLKPDTSSLPPLIMYYTPAPPPKQQQNRRKLKKYYLSAKDYCKWHRMVFPGENHPTIAQASRLRKMHDPEDLRQIHRIARMLPDGQPLKPWTPKYRNKWLKWRELRRKALEED